MPLLTKWFPRCRSVWFSIIAVLVFCASTTIAAAAAPVVRQQDLVTVEAPAGHETYAESVLGHANAALRRLNQATGDNLLVQIRFIIAVDEKTFLSYAGGEGENSLAVSLGGQQTIVISKPAMMKSGADKIQQVLAHELAHVYLDVRCEGHVPRWVHEGVAQVVAGEWTEAPGDATMALAAYTGGIIPLRDLVYGFPRDAVQRNFAYAEAYSAVRFIVREDYENSLRHFLGAIAGPEGRKKLQGYSGGVELAALQARWVDSLKSPLHLTALLLGSGLFWGFAALLVIAAYFVVRQRSKRIRQHWAAEEAMAAEWNEPLDDAQWTTDSPWVGNEEVSEDTWQEDEEWEDQKWRGDN